MVSRYAAPLEMSDSGLISGFTEHINKLNEEKTELAMQMEAMSNEYNTALALLNNELQKYAMQVNQLTAEKHEREVDVRKYVESKKEELHLVVTEMDELNKENQALRNKSDKTIAALRGEIGELEEQLKIIRKAEAEHTNTILQLKSENARLVTQNAQLINQKAQLLEQNAQLLSQNTKVIEGLSKKAADHKKLKSELERVKSANTYMMSASSNRDLNTDEVVLSSRTSVEGNNGTGRGLSRKKSSESMVGSVATYRSGMTEADEIKHALLLSQQESEFRTNMYDSLTSADSGKMLEYRNKGYTRSQAALLIFEEKFGRHGSQSPTMLRTSSAKENRVTQAPAQQYPPMHRSMSADTADYKRYHEIQRQQQQQQSQMLVRPGSPLYAHQQQRSAPSRTQSMSPPRSRGQEQYPQETRERSTSQLRAAQQALIAEGPQHRRSHSQELQHQQMQAQYEGNAPLSRSSRPSSTSMLPIQSYTQQQLQQDAQSVSTTSVKVRRGSFSNASTSSNLTVANMMTNPYVGGNTVTARQLQEYYNIVK